MQLGVLDLAPRTLPNIAVDVQHKDFIRQIDLSFVYFIRYLFHAFLLTHMRLVFALKIGVRQSAPA